MISKSCRLYDVQLGPTDVLGAALLHPPFCDDLTTWRLTIDESGLVTEDIYLYCYPLYTTDQVFTRTTQITEVQLEELLRLADEIDFAGLNEEYDQDWTDDATTAIVQRTPEGVKHVYAYGAHQAAHDGDFEMQRYVRLWDAIVEHSPINSPAWRQEREDIERKSYIEQLKRRIAEKDFQPPSLQEFLFVVLVLPFFIFVMSLFPKSGRIELPTLVEFLFFTGIVYAVSILVQIYIFYSRRRDRLETEQRLLQYESERSEFNDL